jgi:hypothetical protein
MMSVRKLQRDALFSRQSRKRFAQAIRFDVIAHVDVVVRRRDERELALAMQPP